MIYKSMRTALAASVAAVAKGIFAAVSLGLQAVLERRQIYIESFLNIYKLLMKTALVSSVAALPNGFLGLFLWGCRLFRNGGKSTLKAF